MLPTIVVVVVALLVAAGFWWLHARRTSTTVLKKDVATKGSGLHTRVYIRRPGLRTKVWFEQSGSSEAFDVHCRGLDDGYTVTPVPGEAVHITEARDALHDIGLDLQRCSWSEILERAG